MQPLTSSLTAETVTARQLNLQAGACGHLRESRIGLMGRYPPGLPGLTLQDLDRIITGILCSACSAALVIELCSRWCRIMPKNLKPDRPLRHHSAWGTILAGSRYTLLPRRRTARKGGGWLSLRPSPGRLSEALYRFKMP